MDERQKNNVSSAMAKVLIVVYVLVVAYGAIKFLSSFDVTDCIFELIISIVAPILVWIFSRSKKKKTVFPMTIAGLAVFPDRTKEAKIGRIKAYAKDSLSFTVTILAIEIIFELWNRFSEHTLSMINFEVIKNYAIGLLSQAAICFVVFFVMNYIMYEHKSKKYCKENSTVD